jgi:WD40 repeat protein
MGTEPLVVLAGDSLVSMAQLPERPRDIDDAVFSPDSRRIALTGPVATVWTTRGQLVARLQGAAFAGSIAWTADSRHLIVGWTDGWVEVADLASTHRERFKSHDNYIQSITVSADGALIATAGGDRRIALWDAGTHRQLFATAINDLARLRFDDASGSLIAAGVHRVEAWRARRSEIRDDALADLVRCGVELELKDARLIETSGAGCSRGAQQ